MDYKEKIMKVEEKIKNKEYESAEQDLLQIINDEEIKSPEDENHIYYTFFNYIEEIIYFNTIKDQTKKYVKINTNIADAYMMLGFINNGTKNYEKAIQYLNKASEWNPINPQIILERAQSYLCLGNIERYKAEVEKSYLFIYSSYFMARYYRDLGFYYSTKKIFDLANALYTYSNAFSYNERAKIELEYIAKQENREFRLSTKEEIKKILTDYNIPRGISESVSQMIYRESQQLLKAGKEDGTFRFLYRVLYDITLDKRFMLYRDLKDEKTGITLQVPDTWKTLDRGLYSKAGVSDKTLFLFFAENNEAVSIVCDGKCNPENLAEIYKLNIENMKNHGMVIEGEYVTRTSREIRQVFVQMNQNGRKIRAFQNYLVVNGYLINVAWEVSSSEPLEKVLVAEINSLKGQLLWSLRGAEEGTSIQEATLGLCNEINNLIAQGKTPQEAAAELITKMNELVQQGKNPQETALELSAILNNLIAQGKIPQEVAEIAFGNNNEKKENSVINTIVKQYNEGGINSNLMKLIKDFSEDTLKQQDIKDPFWSTMAVSMLETLIMLNLADNKVDISSLIEQSGDINKARLLYKNNGNKIDVEKIENNSNYINSLKLLSDENKDKTLSSILEIVNKALLPYGKNDVNKSVESKEENVKNQVVSNESKESELKEYSLEIEGYPTFKLYFPKNLGNYFKKSEHVFEIKDGNIQKIRVMIYKCESEEKLEADSKKWIEKNKIDAEMEEVEYRKEKINNIPIETYILKHKNKPQSVNKIYKAGYVNNCRITISGGMVKGKEKVINNAFETLTWEGK